MSDLYFQLHFIHRCDTGNFDIDIWLEVSRVLLVGNECLHFIPEKLHILNRRAKVDIDRKLFTHSLRPRNVLNPHGIEHDVGYLCQFVGVNVLKNCKEQRDVFDD